MTITLLYTAHYYLCFDEVLYHIFHSCLNTEYLCFHGIWTTNNIDIRYNWISCNYSNYDLLKQSFIAHVNLTNFFRKLMTIKWEFAESVFHINLTAI